MSRWEVEKGGLCGPWGFSGCVGLVSAWPGARATGVSSPGADGRGRCWSWKSGRRVGSGGARVRARVRARDAGREGGGNGRCPRQGVWDTGQRAQRTQREDSGMLCRELRLWVWVEGPQPGKFGERKACSLPQNTAPLWGFTLPKPESARCTRNKYAEGPGVLCFSLAADVEASGPWFIGDPGPSLSSWLPPAG